MVGDQNNANAALKPDVLRLRLQRQVRVKLADRSVERIPI